MNPFAKVPEPSIGSLGETELIRRMSDWLGDASPPAPAGIGDDCAVVSAHGTQVVTTDPVIYQKHFDDQISPEQAARKLVRRNLSDVAAMGATPAYAILSLAIDPNVSVSWIERFYHEIAQEAKRFAFAIVGGDVSSADSFLGVFMTLVGDMQSGRKALPRHQAKTGSPIYVTGTLGGTRLSKHHDFTPRLAEGQWLASHSNCLSCTDVSDGIGKDLANLIPPGGAIEVDCDRVPLSSDAQSLSASSGKTALYHAFNDGEDYELLFALAPDASQAELETAWSKDFRTQLTCIGRCLEKQENCSSVQLLNAPKDLNATGYEHLR